MANVFVIKRKPFLYKLGAKIFKWLVLSNKVVEYERLGKVIEADKIGCLGYNIIWQETALLKENE